MQGLSEVVELRRVMNLPFSRALVNFDSSQIGPYFEGSMLVSSLHQKIAVVHFGESDVRSHNSFKDLVLLLRTFFFVSHISFQITVWLWSKSQTNIEILKCDLSCIELKFMM